MDEYYGLDYEDLIGGDLPTRFKYRQVDPTGYGITDQEILHEDERSLSKRVPLRFVKRPYAKIDAGLTKTRSNRLKWEAKREEKEKGRVEDARAKAAKFGKEAKAKRLSLIHI